MDKKKEIIISGVGGQGMILCGTLIAKAAVIHDNMLATLASEYGTETRGTFSKSDVVISDLDHPIDFPEATEPDLVICLHPVAYKRYSGKIRKEALLIYNSDLVEPNAEFADRECGIPISTRAKELGNPATANIYTMGVILGYLNKISREGAKDAIADFFKAKGEKVIALNHKAFDAGYECGKELKGVIA